MPDRAPHARPPLVLIVNDQEWVSRSLESILGPSGYAVLRAYSGKEAVQRARNAQPDLIILDLHLPDADAMDLCRALRQDAQIGDTTPILMMTSTHSTRAQRLAALRAGAWEFLTPPLDSEELLLKLDAYVRAKLEADRLREEGLVDQASGLYNVRGLARRARELGSEAFRQHTPLACVVFGLDPAGVGTGAELDVAAGVTAAAAAIMHAGEILKTAGRVSDAIGRLGRTEFAVIAPFTGVDGAVKLAQRLAQAIETAKPKAETPAPAITVRAGYEAVADQHATPVEPVDLLVRATTALRMSRAEGNGERIRRYEKRLGTA